MAAEDYLPSLDPYDEPDWPEDDGDPGPEHDPGPWFDLRHDNGDVTIVNPKTGGRKAFRVHTQLFGDEPKRVLALLRHGYDREERRAWEGFAFVSTRGVHLWLKHLDTPFEKYAKLLEHHEAGEASGLVYYWRKDR